MVWGTHISGNLHIDAIDVSIDGFVAGMECPDSCQRMKQAASQRSCHGFLDALFIEVKGILKAEVYTIGFTTVLIDAMVNIPI